MAFAHGKNGVFKVDDSGGTLRDLSAFCDNIQFPSNQDASETTTFGVAGSSRTYLPGLNGRTITVSGKWDNTASTGPDAVLFGLVGASVASSTFEYGPEGGTAGKIRYTGECIITQYQPTTPLADVVTFTAAFTITGQVTRNTF